jgi:hypothetical protein
LIAKSFATQLVPRRQASLRSPVIAADNAAMEAEPPKADLPKRKRRRFQFRLRTLLIGVAILAVPCAYVGRQAMIVRERQTIIKNELINAMTIDASGRDKVAPGRPDIPWIRRLLGDEDCLKIFAPRSATDEDIERFRSAFPEAEVKRMSDRGWETPPRR